MQVHKEKVDKVPNALPGRNNIEIEIYGMEGIPEEDIREHERHKQGKGGGGAAGLLPPPDAADDDEDTMDMPGGPPGQNPMGGMVPPMPPMPPPNMPGMPPMGMPPGMGHMGHMGHMPPMGHMGQMQPRMPLMRPGGPMMRPPQPPQMSQQQQQQPQPPKPLFPSAGQASVKSSSAPVGPDFRPTGGGGGPPGGQVRPTFPAYSQSGPSPPTSSASRQQTSSPAPATIKKPESSSGMTIQLVHPDEDVSLEELRATLPKYKKAVQTHSHQPQAPAPQMGGGQMRMNGPGMMQPGGAAQPRPRPPMHMGQMGQPHMMAGGYPGAQQAYAGGYQVPMGHTLLGHHPLHNNGPMGPQGMPPMGMGGPHMGYNMMPPRPHMMHNQGRY